MILRLELGRINCREMTQDLPVTFHSDFISFEQALEKLQQLLAWLGIYWVPLSKTLFSSWMLPMKGKILFSNFFSEHFYLWKKNLIIFLKFFYRGIDVVRNRIKMFAQQKVTLPRGRHKIGTINILRKHFYSTKLNLTKVSFFGQCSDQ